MQMMWRLNFFVFFVCLVMRNDYVLYYICPMHTLFTLFVYFSLLVAGLTHCRLPYYSNQMCHIYSATPRLERRATFRVPRLDPRLLITL